MENEGFRVDAIKGVATWYLSNGVRDVFRRNFFEFLMTYRGILNYDSRFLNIQRFSEELR